MPYEQHWIPAPKDMSLPVRKDIPEGVEQNWLGYRSVTKGGLVRWYHCHYCDGWIEGHPSDYEVNNNLGSLGGREGTEYYCKRCGEEIAFFGKMA